VAPPAQAQQAPAGGPFSSVLGALGLTPPHQAPMPDFVTRTQPARTDLHYLPVWSARPQPPDEPLTRAGIESQEAELEALRSRDAVRAGHKPVVVKALSAAGRPYVAKKKKGKPDCRITCVVDVTKIGQRQSMQ
jgi:hypothetical protein